MFLRVALKKPWNVKTRCPFTTRDLWMPDTLTIMPDKASADNFLESLNHCHLSIKFTMETESNSMLPFLDTRLLNKHTHVETKVYVKPTNTGLLLHCKSHVIIWLDNDRFMVETSSFTVNFYRQLHILRIFQTLI